MSQNRPEHSSWAQEIRKPGERPVWLWWLLQRMEEKGNGFLFPLSPLDILSPFSLHHLGGVGGWDRSSNPGPAWLWSQTEEPSYFISSALGGIRLFYSNNTRVADAPSNNRVTKLDPKGSVKSSIVPRAGVKEAQALLCTSGGFPYGNAEAKWASVSLARRRNWNWSLEEIINLRK